MICKRCGKTIKLKSLKCGSCGTRHSFSECSGIDFDKHRVHHATVTQKTFGANSGDEKTAFPKKYIALIAGVAAVVTVAGAITGVMIWKKSSLPDTPNTVVVNEEESLYQETSVKFSNLGMLDMIVEGPEGAKEALKLVRGIYGYTENIDEHLRYTEKTVASETSEHYIFEQVYNGKQVYGKSMIVTVSRASKKVISISGNYKKLEAEYASGVMPADETEAVTAEKAKDLAMKRSGANVISDPQNVALCMDKLVDVWHVELERENKIVNMFINVKNGRTVLEEEEHIVTDIEQKKARKALGKSAARFPYEEKDNLVILNPIEPNIPFRSKVVSSSLFEMNRELEMDPPFKEEIEGIWRDAVYLLPAEADFIDCVTAADILAESRGMETDRRLKMLQLLKKYNQSPEAEIELVGKNPTLVINDATGNPYEGYTYEIFVCDSEMNIVGDPIAKGKGTDEVKNYKLEVGKVYCLVVAESEDRYDNKRREYIYCSDTDTNYELHTNFNKNSNEVTL